MKNAIIEANLFDIMRVRNHLDDFLQIMQSLMDARCNTTFILHIDTIDTIDTDTNVLVPCNHPVDYCSCDMVTPEALEAFFGKCHLTFSTTDPDYTNKVPFTFNLNQ